MKNSFENINHDMSSEKSHDCEMCSRFGTHAIVQEMLERDLRREEKREKQCNSKK